jgi:pimeloyl-ACP methyl ester carboxylesterase
LTEAFREFTYVVADGLKLYGRVYEPREATDSLPVVCLAGLTRNSRDFHELAVSLAQHAQTPRRVVTLDYRGRGLSAYDPDWSHYNIGTEAGDVIAGLAMRNIERAVFIGTSRGGLIIHILAVIAPQLLAGVILNDIGPEITGDGLKQISEYLGRSPTPENWAQAVELQRAVHGAAFTAVTEDDWERSTRAIYREKSGAIVPDYDPNLLRTLEGIDFTQELPNLWPQFDLLSRLAFWWFGAKTPGFWRRKPWRK